MLNRKDLLERLKEDFEEYENQLGILRWIDEATINEGMTLDIFFPKLSTKLSETLRTQFIRIYAICENKWLPIKIDNCQIELDAAGNVPERPELPNEVRNGHVALSYNWNGYRNTNVP